MNHCLICVFYSTQNKKTCFAYPVFLLEMTSNEQKTSDVTYLTGDLSSHTKNSPRDFASTDLSQTQQDKYDFHSNASTLLEEVTTNLSPI